MKKRFSFLVSFFAISSLLLAQEKLNPLTAPSSPASSVLGMQASEVLSPKSYEELEAALYSNFLNGNGSAVIPNDFALEFTPYWTKNHGLSLEDYLYPENVFTDQFIRNSSFSLASTQNFLLGDSTASNALAWGYRTTFYFANGNDRKKVEAYRKKVTELLKIESKIGSQAEVMVSQETIKTKEDFLKSMRPEVIKAISSIAGYEDKAEEITQQIYDDASVLPDYKKEKTDTLLDAFYHLIEEHLSTDSVFDAFEDHIRNRQGLAVDIAYGALMSFPTNDFEYSIVPKQSFWVTPTYRFKNNWDFLRIMAVYRYEWNSIDYYKKFFPLLKIYRDNKDYGLAVSLEFKKFSLQFEGVSRTSQTETPVGFDTNGNQLYIKENNSDLQYMGTFSYRVNDQIALTYTLGNRFEPILNPGNTLVSLLSLNFGFGSPDKNDIK